MTCNCIDVGVFCEGLNEIKTKQEKGKKGISVGFHHYGFLARLHDVNGNNKASSITELHKVLLSISPKREKKGAKVVKLCNVPE